MSQGDGEERGAISRRMVLSVGGITLLAGCSAPVAKLTDTARAKPLPSRTAGPSADGSATRGGGTRGGGTRGGGTRGGGTRGGGTRHPAGGPGGHPAGPPSKPSEPMFYVGDRSKTIALTIDDGPSSIYTPQVLRLLAKYQVTAMFSMIGIEVKALPGVARDVARAGHEIANHTWRHLDLGTLAPSAVASEMNRATDAIHGATGILPGRFRAPYGVWSPTVLRHCAAMDMMPVDWSVDPTDWARPGVSYIVRDIMRTTHRGSIILEHDGGGDRSQTVAALKIVIPRLLDEGYHFVTP